MAISYGLCSVTTLEKPVNRQQLLSLLNKADAMQSYVSGSKENYQFSDAELTDALNEGQLKPFFQPHINAQTQCVVGAEALVRWHHPEQGVLAPYQFLNRLMQLGLSYKLTLSMLDQVIKACASWWQQGLQYGVSINVSPSDLVNMNFAEDVFSLLSRHALPSHFLTIEVTETEISPHLAKSLETLSRLRIYGIKTSIDDYGTGHSSLTQLITSPFSELKIDQYFVHNMLHEYKHMIAVEATVLLAQALGLKIVAEGVETIEQARVLQKLGCDIFQGYYYSPALPEIAFLQWSQNHSDKSNYKNLLNVI